MSATRVQRANSGDVCHGRVVIPVEFSPRGRSSLPLAQTAAHASHVIRHLIHVQATALSREEDANDASSLFILSTKASISGSDPVPGQFPDLREVHTQLLQRGASAFALLNTETDRITNSLNTLSEQVAEWSSGLAH